MIDMAEHRWYAIQTTAGHENKVRSLIQRKIEADARPAEERPIRQALVPTEQAVEIKNGIRMTYSIAEGSPEQAAIVMQRRIDSAKATALARAEGRAIVVDVAPSDPEAL